MDKKKDTDAAGAGTLPAEDAGTADMPVPADDMLINSVFINQTSLKKPDKRIIHYKFQGNLLNYCLFATLLLKFSL